MRRPFAAPREPARWSAAWRAPSAHSPLKSGDFVLTQGASHLRPDVRVSRLLLLADDGAERFYRHVETLLRRHGPRVLAVRLDLDAHALGELLFGPGRLVRLLMIVHKEAVSAILLTMPEDGDLIQYHFERPHEIPDPIIHQIERLIIEGGGVGTSWVRENLINAFLVAYALHGDRIVGSSSHKHPKESYKKKIEEATGPGSFRVSGARIHGRGS